MAIRWLFVDMNSYFASVEQQMHPSLRGRPVGVCPVVTDSSCVIAASYEAKAYGVKTGTGVAEAKLLCPSIQLVEANPQEYREYHFAIVDAVEQCIPVTNVLSVDEMVCKLWDNERQLVDALRLGETIQTRIKKDVGEWMSASVGLAPNPFLAKVASDFQKPRGLSVIDHSDIPHKLHRLKLTDWPGIARGNEARLNAAGVTTTEQMYQLTMPAMRRIWGSIEGERWYRQIRGEIVDRPETKRGQFGQSMILPPDLRTARGCRAVAARLIEKAAERMRVSSFHCGRLWVQVVSRNNPGWSAKIKFAPARDTFTLMRAFELIWRDECAQPFQVAVGLTDTMPDTDVSLSLFGNEAWSTATDTVDAINSRFGRRSIMWGSALPVRDQVGDRIPFGAVDPTFMMRPTRVKPLAGEPLAGATVSIDEWAII